MPRQPSYTLLYAPELAEHLNAIPQKHHSFIDRMIVEQLSVTPTEQTRNRKPLQQPAPLGARWELRFGRGNRYRVLYKTDDAARTVSILAIGVKDGNRLLVGGKEVAP